MKKFKEAELDYFKELVESCEGNRNKMARASGLTIKTIRKKIRQPEIKIVLRGRVGIRGKPIDKVSDDGEKKFCEAELDYFKELVKFCKGNRSKMAEVSGLSIRTIRNKMNIQFIDIERNLQ